MSLLAAFKLADVERIVFQRPPLVVALCQVRFPPVLGVTEPSYVHPFQRALKPEYPILTPTTKVELQVELAPEPSVERRTLSPEWRFTDRKQTWTVVLTSGFMALETRQYTHFDEFIQRMQRVLTALVEHIQPAAVARIGLRYINEIRMPDASPVTAIRQELLGPLSHLELREHATLAVQELRLQFPDDESIHIRHGLMPEGTTVEPRPREQMPIGPFYLLDFDVFRTFPPDDLLGMDIEAIGNHISAYHDAIDRLFRWSITDDYTASLGVRRRVR